MCLCGAETHLLKALKGNQICLFRAVSAERPWCGSFNPSTSQKGNLISLGRQSRRKRPQQFDVSTPFYCQYFDRFHDSIIICLDLCQGFNCYMRNYTFSCGDVGTEYWLCYYYYSTNSLFNLGCFMLSLWFHNPAMKGDILQTLRGQLSQINSLPHNICRQGRIFHGSIHYPTSGSWKALADRSFEHWYQLSLFRKMTREQTNWWQLSIRKSFWAIQGP